MVKFPLTSTEIGQGMYSQTHFSAPIVMTSITNLFYDPDAKE